MSSEVPSTPKSNNRDRDSLESTQSDELRVESTSDITDIWLEDDYSDATVTIESEAESEEPDTTIEVNAPELDPANEMSDTEIETLAEVTASKIDNSPEVIEVETTNEDNPEQPASPPDDLEEITEIETTTEASSEVTASQANDVRDVTEDRPEQPASEKSELFVDSWLDEPKKTPSSEDAVSQDEIDRLEQQKTALQSEIAELKAQKEQMLLAQVREVQEHMGRMVEEGTKELKERKTALQIEIEKLERRRERINQEMRTSFAGSSQELAVKVQGFKDYLVGSLQDLARAAEKLELTNSETAPPTRRRVRNPEEMRDRPRRTRSDRPRRNSPSPASTQFSEPTFAEHSRRIRQIINKYRSSPDYYGSPWQLRRTFEAVHAKKVQDWFFVQGGRGAVDSMGSRLQNILVASAAISILRSIHGDRCRVLVLTDTPENLGEWRKGLQDCLGISRTNFGSNRGVTLFDSPEVMVQRAERLIEDKLLPMIVIDETDELLNLSVLKFPLWLAFASTNKSTPSNYLY